MALTGKTALITGGSQGIGAAVVRRFSKENANVWFGDIDRKRGNELARELSQAGLSSKFLPLDVTKPSQWKAIIKQIMTTHGKLDILVNNAGIYQRKSIEDTSESDWDKMLEVNAKGPFLGVKSSIHALKASGNASIINLSSTAGLKASLSIHYGASKGALRLMTKSIAIQFAKDGIRCNSVHPGPIDTKMGHEAVPVDQLEERLFQRIPLGRFGTSKEIANAVLFLASDESSFITGSELVVDGGATSK